ncbi:unnamed protein product, partial [Bubo scandiacus]
FSCGSSCPRSTAGKGSACPFLPPCREKRKARQRHPTQARGGCSERHPQDRNRPARPHHGLWKRERSSTDHYYRRSTPAGAPPSTGVSADPPRASLLASPQGLAVAWGYGTGFRAGAGARGSCTWRAGPEPAQGELWRVAEAPGNCPSSPLPALGELPGAAPARLTSSGTGPCRSGGVKLPVPPPPGGRQAADTPPPPHRCPRPSPAASNLAPPAAILQRQHRGATAHAHCGGAGAHRSWRSRGQPAGNRTNPPQNRPSRCAAGPRR